MQGQGGRRPAATVAMRMRELHTSTSAGPVMHASTAFVQTNAGSRSSTVLMQLGAILPDPTATQVVWMLVAVLLKAETQKTCDKKQIN